MADLKKMWQETGKEFDKAFRSLGKTVVRSAKVGIKKVDEWANSVDKDKDGGDTSNKG